MCAMLALFSVHALAQGTTGSLSGTISDSSGVVAGANVQVKSDATGSEFTTQTTENGTFNVPALAVGTYTVTITATNYKRVVVSQVKIDVGKPSSIEILLEAGGSTETVNVIGGGAELINTQNATVGTTISGRQIIDQPQASRDALDLVTLLPGVQTTGRPRTSTVNGLPKGALNITIDGVDVQDNLISSNDGFFTFVRPRVDAIQEVTVSTATPGAESSGDGAVQIKFVTRGGTNEFHGSLYEYHRNPSTFANYWFLNRDGVRDPRINKVRPARVLLNQYGGRAEGPITIPKLFNGKDRAFFFVNYEEFRLPEQQIQQRVVLSPSAQSGIFNYVTGTGVQSVNLYNLAAANGLPSTPDPTINTLLQSIRSSTSQGTIASIANDPNRQNFTYVGQGGQQRYFTTVRLDFKLSKKHSLENIWNYQEFGGAPVDFLNLSDPSFPGFPNTKGQVSQRFTNSTALRSTLTDNLVNEARFGLLGGISLFTGPGGSNQFDNQGGFDLILNTLGISDASANRAGPARFQRFFGNTDTRRNTPVFQFQDNLTWVKGEHSFNFGGSYKLTKAFARNINQVAPTVSFGVAASDPALAIFNTTNFPGASAADLATAAQLYAVLTGRVTSVDYNAYLEEGKYGLLGQQTTRFRQSLFALYAQDSWRLRPNLTLTMGLRWEPQQSATSDIADFARVNYQDLFGVSGTNNLFRPGTLSGSTTQYNSLAAGEKLFQSDNNNFAPTLHVAWALPSFKNRILSTLFGDTGKSVLRGGYSMAFVNEGLANVSSVVTSNPGGVLSANRDVALGSLTPGTLFRNRASLAAAPFPSAPTYPNPGIISDTAFGFDPNLKTGVVHSWTGSLQREIANDTVLEISYVGNRAKDLWRRYNLNEVNVLENGFLNEFRLAQANFAANRAAGRGNTFSYFGAGTGTSPLPIILGYFQGLPAAAAANPANYTSAFFANSTFFNTLSPNAAAPVTFAGTISANPALFRNNGLAAGLPLNNLIVNPDKLGGASLTTNGIETWYNGATIELRRRFSKGLLVQASYTYSQSLTNAFASSQTVLSQPLTLRPERESLERFRAPQDLTHAFKVNWIYDMPFGRGKAFLGGVNKWVDGFVGGWTINGTARIQSGRQFSMGNVQLVGMTREELQDAITIRKNAATVTFLPDDIILNTRRAFNVSLTSANGYSTLGAPEGRYIAPANSRGCVQGFTGQCGFSNLILTGPRFTRFDMSLMKRIRFTERVNLELRGEFLNAFNNVNFLIGGTAAVDVAAIANFNAATFGQVTSAYQDISTTNDPGGRLVQFVIRFNF